MKSKIYKVCLICILAAFSIKTYAAVPVSGDCDKIIKDYITCHMNSDFKKLNKIMGPEATLKIPRQENVIVQTKSDLVEDMQAMGTVKQNCNASFEILAKSDALVIARVDFDYANAVQQNFLILEKNANKEWKITQVCKIFNDKDVIFNDKDVAESPEKVIAKN